MDKLKLLKLTLRIGVLYYLIGAFVHYFDLTLFPWYDANLFAPYHDALIALCAILFALFLFVIAKDPVKNIDTLNVVIMGSFLASIFSIVIIWQVDFAALGAPNKELQTIVEGILGFVFVGSLLWLYPHKKHR